MPRVLIQQLVIPAYRAPFFSGVANNSDGFEVEVHASYHAAGHPSTVQMDFDFPFTAHPCKALAGNRLWWQSGMGLPHGFQRDDLVVFNSNPRVLSNFGLVASAIRRGCRVISWNHYMSSTSGKVSSWIRKKSTACISNFHIVYTEGEVATMLADGYSESEVKSLNNTIDTSEIHRACLDWSDQSQLDTGQDVVEQILQIRRRPGERLQEFQREQGLSQTTNLLICGRLVDKTKVDVLLRSLQILVGDPRLERSVQLLVIGDGPAKARYQQLAHDLELDSNVRWLGAIFGEQELAPWFLSSSLSVFPGAIGLSLNHAMAYGLPVITHSQSDHHGPEFFYLRDGTNGFTFEEDNPDSLAASLLAVHKGTQLEPYSRHALETMHFEYSFSGMVDNFIDALRMASN